MGQRFCCVKTEIGLNNTNNVATDRGKIKPSKESREGVFTQNLKQSKSVLKVWQKRPGMSRLAFFKKWTK
jgi:hypothetical protein